MIKKIFSWIFKQELIQLKQAVSELNIAKAALEVNQKRLENILDNFDISVDHHPYGRSWAVISIQGKKADYIKFIDLGESEIRAIQRFVSQFDRSKVDTAPHFSHFFKI